MRIVLARLSRILVSAIVLASLLTLSVGCSGEADSSAVVFPDPKLEAAIREAIGKPSGDIKQSDFDDLTEFYADDRGIVDLAGLEYCTGLTVLALVENQIGDISPLSGLTSLDLLGLSSNRISDLSPLSNLMSLRTVFLEDNRIGDLSPLSGLTSLTQLNIDRNEISDLSPLSGLTSLEYLQLDANRISDLSPLSGLTSLECLYLNLNQIGDISPISSLAGLWWLGLSVNQISNLSPLSGLTGLKDLDLSFNQITDIEPLVSNPGMADADIVSLSNNPLNSNSVSACIPALEGRGVIVNWADLTRAPWVTTADASSIDTNSARLNGELRWLGTASSVTAYFAWGTTSGGPYANKTTGQEMTSTGAFYFDLEGLHPGVTYYYQARSTGDEDSYSTDESSFTTG